LFGKSKQNQITESFKSEAAFQSVTGLQVSPERNVLEKVLSETRMNSI
jgi:hypothetical protein